MNDSLRSAIFDAIEETQTCVPDHLGYLYLPAKTLNILNFEYRKYCRKHGLKLKPVEDKPT